VRFEAEAKRWLESDPDPKTRAELSQILEGGDEPELVSRFGATLQFGTAGLRAELGAGPNRMNRVVVARTARGLADFLLANRTGYLDPQGELSVVIGYDGRINSDVFARDSAEVFAAAGIRAKLFDRMVPTPVAAFTGRALGASATVMVTASHNPPRDNGYKVYLGGPGGGSQLLSPQDAEIAALIARVDSDFADIEKSGNILSLGQAEINAYQKRALGLMLSSERASALKISYTAMHGVGWPILGPIFAAAGFSVLAVPEQRDADGEFPTVAFPNPEEPGAMDLSFAHAQALQSDLILANDPDADRLAVAIPGGSGNWQMLTGDDVGLILGDLVAQRGATGTLANSIVSADLLGKVAQRFGLDYRQTHTGFKHISKVPGLIFGYEEALGYCVDPQYTPDKDGITAALMIAELADELKSRGSNLGAHLEQLHESYGYLATGQVSIRVNQLSKITELMSDLRGSPPTHVAGEAAALEDLLQSNPSTDALIFKLSGGARLIIRPSGTEPKLKCYLHAPGANQASADRLLEGLRNAAEQLLEAS
jgi:phosphomannomutase